VLTYALSYVSVSTVVIVLRQNFDHELLLCRCPITCEVPSSCFSCRCCKKT